MDMEHHLVVLTQEIGDRTYEVSPGVGFIITKPVRREVFAACFRDRVIHHLLYNRVEGIAERTFITDCYSCRKGYGTSFGIKRLKHHIRSCSDNYTRKAYVLKMDIQGYFMSINRQLLYTKVEAMLAKYAGRTNEKGIKWSDTMDMEQTLYLLRKVIFHDPTADCRLRSKREEWDLLPPSKSLFHSAPGCGLPIGNLTSQLFSNIYLSDFDHYVKRTLGMEHYGRYVDDFYVVHQDKQQLKQLPQLIARYLKEELGLTLHPKKIVLCEVEKGIDFLGVHVKPYRDYVVTRTKRSIRLAMKKLDDELGLKKEMQKEISTPERTMLCAGLNSYLGYLKAFSTFSLRRKLTGQCRNIATVGTFTPSYEKLILQQQSLTPCPTQPDSPTAQQLNNPTAQQPHPVPPPKEREKEIRDEDKRGEAVLR